MLILRLKWHYDNASKVLERPALSKAIEIEEIEGAPRNWSRRWRRQSAAMNHRDSDRRLGAPARFRRLPQGESLPASGTGSHVEDLCSPPLNDIYTIPCKKATTMSTT